MKSEKNSSSIIIVSLILVIICLTGYIVYNKYNSKEKTAINNCSENEKIENKEQLKCPQKNDSYIEATYYGEFDSLKYTYILQKDGTYEANFTGASKKAGTYFINGNTITFIHKSEITAPSEYEFADYESENYYISPDKSYITIYFENDEKMILKEL